MTNKEHCKPVAVRAIAGVGKDGEYFRSLILSISKNDNKEVSMIVPSNIYDIGTQLVLNLKDDLKYIQLTQLLDTTTSYSQFSFDMIKIPAQEQRNIDAIKKGT